MIPLLLKEPELLTTIGTLERFGLNFHDDDLTDESDAFFQKMFAFMQKNLEILRSYPREKQTPEQRPSTDILNVVLQDGAIQLKSLEKRDDKYINASNHVDS